jgi:hypothetical protein
VGGDFLKLIDEYIVSDNTPGHESGEVLQPLAESDNRRSRPCNKFVNVSFTSTNIKNKLTDLCGNRLLQNDFNNTLCE